MVRTLCAQIREKERESGMYVGTTPLGGRGGITAYSVNQFAILTHCPRNSHAIVIQRILRYLKSNRTKGITIFQLNEFRADCYVDSPLTGRCPTS